MQKKDRRSQPSYQGALRTPVARRQIGLLDDPKAEGERIAKEMVAKVPLLARAHGITGFDYSPPAVLQLMLALARAHVPGFRVSEPPGRPHGPLGPLDLVHLRREVDAIMATTGKKQLDAIEHVKRSEQWRDQLRGRTVAALKQQLKDGRWSRIVEDAEAWQAIESGARYREDK